QAHPRDVPRRLQGLRHGGGGRKAVLAGADIAARTRENLPGLPGQGQRNDRRRTPGRLGRDLPSRTQIGIAYSVSPNVQRRGSQPRGHVQARGATPSSGSAPPLTLCRPQERTPPAAAQPLAKAALTRIGWLTVRVSASMRKTTLTASPSAVVMPLP